MGEGTEKVIDMTGAGMAAFTITSLPNLGNDFNNGDKILTDKFAKEIIDVLEDYKKTVKKFRGDFADYARVSKNFINHVTKELKNYRSLITSCISKVDAKTIGSYRDKFCKCVDEIEENCNNSSVENLTNNEYKSFIGGYTSGLGLKLTQSSGILIGDFAKSLGGCANKTKKEIEKLNVGNFIKTLYKENPSKSKRYWQLLKERFSNDKPGAIETVSQDALDSLIDDAVKVTGKKMMNAYNILCSIEYHKFPAESSIKANNIFGIIRSEVHSAKNILNAYAKTLKTYPIELRKYVEDCNDCIKKLTKYLDNCFSVSKELSKSSLAFEKREKAIATLNYNLGRVQNTINGVIGESAKGPVKDWLGAKTMDITKILNAYGGGFFTGIYEGNVSTNRQYVIGGWTLGHFLKAFNDFINMVISVRNSATTAEYATDKKDKKVAQQDSTEALEQESAKEYEKVKDKVKKLYLGALESAARCFISTLRTKNKAQNIYDTMEKCDEAIKKSEGFDSSYKTNFEKLMGTKTDKADTSTGFGKFEALWSGLSEYKIDDTDCFVVTVDRDSHTYKINKDVVHIVLDPLTSPDFIEGVLKNLKDLEHQGKKIKKSVDNFVRVYKDSAEYVKKEQKKLARKKS